MSQRGYQQEMAAREHRAISAERENERLRALVRQLGDALALPFTEGAYERHQALASYREWTE